MPGDPFYYSPAWRRVRSAALQRDRFRCTAPRCGQPASHVDHVLARAAGGAPLDLANLRSLCASCHSRKTARADGGFGHRRRSATWGCDASGIPLDPTHPWREGGGCRKYTGRHPQPFSGTIPATIDGSGVVDRAEGER